ncbi:MAG: VOC family protein [Actinomycetota bacterium]
MSTVSVRYFVDEVDAAIAFYTQNLGFDVEFYPGAGFAILSRGDLRPPPEHSGRSTWWSCNRREYSSWWAVSLLRG